MTRTRALLACLTLSLTAAAVPATALAAPAPERLVVLLDRDSAGPTARASAATAFAARNGLLAINVEDEDARLGPGGDGDVELRGRNAPPPPNGLPQVKSRLLIGHSVLQPMIRGRDLTPWKARKDGPTPGGDIVEGCAFHACPSSGSTSVCSRHRHVSGLAREFERSSRATRDERRGMWNTSERQSWPLIDPGARPTRRP